MDYGHRKKLDYLRSNLTSVWIKRRLEGTALKRGVEDLQSGQKLLSDFGSSCLLPVLGGGSSVSLCGSTDTQRSHIHSKPLLRGIGSPGSSPDSLFVLERLATDALYLANATKEGRSGKIGDKPVWEIGRVRPRSVRVRSASVRGFSCNGHDREVFRLIENIPVSFPQGFSPRVVQDKGLPFSSADLFQYQLFLFNYRALVGTVSVFRGLSRSFSNLMGGIMCHREVFGR